jgi:hypothetical protein
MAVKRLSGFPQPEGDAQPGAGQAAGSLASWSRDVLLVGLVLVGLFLLEGWLYVRTYFNFFRIPTEGLDITPQELLFQGVHALLFPLIVVPVALFLRLYARRMFLMTLGVVAGCAAILAYFAYAFHWYPAMDIMVQTAAVLWIGMAVLAIQRGFGQDNVRQRFLLVGAALLLLVSLPTAFGTVDAGAKATVKRSHLLLTSTHELGLPNPTKSGNLIEYRNFVLLRETGSRYWVMTLGLSSDVYSIARSEVLYIRY